jgi:hypothetical protein
VAGESAPDAKRARLEVHVLPLVGRELTLAHPGAEDEDVEGFEPVSGRRFA